MTKLAACALIYCIQRISETRLLCPRLIGERTPSTKLRTVAALSRLHCSRPDSQLDIGALMDHNAEQQPKEKAQDQGEHVTVTEGHHYAAPEVEEWKPHPYEGEGVHRRESLKGDLPEERQKTE